MNVFISLKVFITYRVLDRNPSRVNYSGNFIEVIDSTLHHMVDCGRIVLLICLHAELLFLVHSMEDQLAEGIS